MPKPFQTAKIIEQTLLAVAQTDRAVACLDSDPLSPVDLAEVRRELLGIREKLLAIRKDIEAQRPNPYCLYTSVRGWEEARDALDREVSRATYVFQRTRVIGDGREREGRERELAFDAYEKYLLPALKAFARYGANEAECHDAVVKAFERKARVTRGTLPRKIEKGARTK
jgi:hypothetical protein